MGYQKAQYRGTRRLSASSPSLSILDATEAFRAVLQPAWLTGCLNIYSEIDTLSLRYKSVSFGAEKNLC